MAHTPEPRSSKLSDLVIHRDPPSNYASVTYAMSILAVAILLVATAASGLFNAGTSAPPEHAAAQSKSEPPAPSADVSKKREAAPDAATPPSQQPPQPEAPAQAPQQ